MSHRATTWEWAQVESSQPHAAPLSCLLELRDRIEALEAAANHPAIPDSSPAPADGLVERVQAAIDGELTAPHEARASILAVAQWLDTQDVGAGRAAARWLREEVEGGNA